MRFIRRTVGCIKKAETEGIRNDMHKYSKKGPNKAPKKHRKNGTLPAVIVTVPIVSAINLCMLVVHRSAAPIFMETWITKSI